MILYTDAGTQKNGKPGQKSKICVASEYQVFVDEPIGNYTINEAEMIEIGKAVELCLNNESDIHTIYSDSKLAVNMITGTWKGKKAHLRELAQRIRSGFKQKNIELKWITRWKNLAGIYLETGTLKPDSPSGKYDNLFKF